MDIHFELNGESFVWNASKADQNKRKHGIRFEEAASVFFDPLLTLVDASRNAESREAAIGFDAMGRLLLVVHIELEADAIRIISARQTEPKEELLYAD